MKQRINIAALHNYNYEVEFIHGFYDSGDNAGEITCWTDIAQANNWHLSQGNSSARHNQLIIILPVGSTRKYYFKLTDANTKHNCYAILYRRIGTNS